MKALAKFLTVITVVALLLSVYVMQARKLRVTRSDVTVQLAADVPETFADAYEAAMNGYSNITMFADRIDDNPQAYNIITYTYTVSNWSPLPAEWLRIDLAPVTGDIMQIHEEISDVPGFGQATIRTMLMVPWGASNLERAMTLAYYSYGRAVSVGA